MGYTAIAEMMGKHPDVAIFRRFSVLNAKNLLYLQAELVQLEDDLKDQIDQDKKDGLAESKLPDDPDRDWQDLKKAKKQWQMFEEIRAKLKEYNEALNLQVVASGLVKPRGHELHVLRKMFEYSDLHGSGLQGLDRPVWENLDDLIVLKSPLKLDFLSSLFMSGVLYALGIRQRLCEIFGMEKDDTASIINNSSVNYDDKYIYIEDDRLYKIVNMITTVISSVLPITSVIVLYFVHNLGARLGIIAAFMVLFSLTLALATDAKRPDIFAATSGFAAVLVIFVGSTS